jgi:predicted AlkP superfamily pyrophosphatase or phosphodiesterase
LQTPQGAPDAVSRWIAESAKWIENRHHPTLSLIYLPHLDYNLQRHGPYTGAASAGNTQPALNPAIVPDLRSIDAIVGDLLEFFAKQLVRVILLSEYGITPVNTAVHLNRLFRNQGWLAIKDELGLELLDCGASKVFAVADHQVAHIYLNDPSLRDRARALLEKTAGVAAVLDAKGKNEAGIDHPRAGDLIAVAESNAWFTYYYWMEDHLAPDFARTVDIHRKPGYDPVELFLDPQIKLPKLKIAWRLLQKKLGLRMLMDVIPLDATLVKGSHGARPANSSDYPVLISPRPELLHNESIEATEVYHVVKRHLLG